MSFNEVNELRRSAAVMTSGPGAIVDARSGSAPVSGVHGGLESWDVEAPLAGQLSQQKIYERRLLAKLKVSYFRLPPVIASDPISRKTMGGPDASLLLRRFPNWLQCSTCSIIKPATRWSTDPGQAYRFCSTCTSKNPGKSKEWAIPVRLVAACSKGHLDDFPWDWWVQHQPNCDAKNRELELYSKGMGLGAFQLRCRTCKRERSMESAFNKSALAGRKCNGRRPWLDSDDVDCDCTGENGEYRALQRGASNLYYPIFESALDIPPWTEPIQMILNDRWDDLADLTSREDRLAYIRFSRSILDAAAQAGFSAEDLIDAFESMQEQAGHAAMNEIRQDEFRVFDGLAPTRHQEFESYPHKCKGMLENYVETLTRVPRLREVRVLTGFTRIRPPQEGQRTESAPLATSSKNWLPAIEIRGEGIFLSLPRDKIAVWKKLPAVVSRTSQIEAAFQADYLKRAVDGQQAPRLTSTKILLHSLSHALMKQLTLECGYSSASLRERLYVDDEESMMAGLLIFTGTADSDGTLGGLQTRGEEYSFEETLRSAIRSSRWCSSDPICIEGNMSSREMHSGASCHSCLLAPETSCELFNKYLDRALLIGTPEDPQIGFFSACE